MATFLAVLVVLGFGIWNNTGMWDAFLYGMVPLMPLVTWGIDLYKQHQANIKALSNIEVLIEDGLQQAGQTKRVNNHLWVLLISAKHTNIISREVWWERIMSSAKH